MKVLLTKTDKYRGIFSAIQEIFPNHMVLQNQPVFEVVNRYRPDIVFCCNDYTSQHMIRALQEAGPTLVTFGDFIPEGLVPNVACIPSNISAIMEKNLCSNPAVQVVKIENYADLSIFKRSADELKIHCDIGFINTSLNNAIEKVRLLSVLARSYKVLVVGRQLPIPQYLGNIPLNRCPAFWKSSKINLSWDSEDIINIAGCGEFALSTVENKLFPKLDLNNVDQVPSFLANEKARNKISRKARATIVEGHTCYHRLLDIVEKLDMFDVQQDIQKVIEGLK